MTIHHHTYTDSKRAGFSYGRSFAGDPSTAIKRISRLADSGDPYWRGVIEGLDARDRSKANSYPTHNPSI